MSSGRLSYIIVTFQAGGGGGLTKVAAVEVVRNGRFWLYCYSITIVIFFNKLIDFSGGSRGRETLICSTFLCSH